MPSKVPASAARLVALALAWGALAGPFPARSDSGVFARGEVVIYQDPASGVTRPCQVEAVDSHGVLVKFRAPNGSFDAPKSERKYVARHTLRHEGEPATVEEALPKPVSGPATFESGPIVPLKPAVETAAPSAKATAGSLPVKIKPHPKRKVRHTKRSPG